LHSDYVVAIRGRAAANPNARSKSALKWRLVYHLLSNAQCDRVEVVLVSPRNPLNIGAAARAMANFGFARLSVVAPHEPHWREAKSAIGADELLQNARIAERLADAVADCTLVIGTGSLERRKPNQPVVPLPDLAPFIQKEIARNGRIALVFGSEKRGLTQEDLSYCHLLAVIPTDPQQPSMNLGQAVAVCLYEISYRIGGPIVVPSGDTATAHPRQGPADDPATPASTRDLELLAGLVEETMLAVNYSPPSMSKANRHDLHLLLRRLALTRSDTGRILGFFRRILWRLKHESNRT
jgi:TrmH family RNA methyltransferase